VKGKLTPKQEHFCQLYVTHWNAARAAVEAGYSADSAKERGYELRHNPSLSKRIDELTEHALEEMGVTRGRVLSELAAIATADMTQAFDEMGQMKPLSEIPEDVRRSLNGLEVHEIFDGQGEDKHAIGLARKFKAYDKTKALELLGKKLKLFTDRHEHSGPDGKPIETKNVSDLPDEQLDAAIAAHMAKAKPANEPQ